MFKFIDNLVGSVNYARLETQLDEINREIAYCEKMGWIEEVKRLNDLWIDIYKEQTDYYLMMSQ